MRKREREGRYDVFLMLRYILCALPSASCSRELRQGKRVSERDGVRGKEIDGEPASVVKL